MPTESGLFLPSHNATTYAATSGDLGFLSGGCVFVTGALKRKDGPSIRIVMQWCCRRSTSDAGVRFEPGPSDFFNASMHVFPELVDPEPDDLPAGVAEHTVPVQIIHNP